MGIPEYQGSSTVRTGCKILNLSTLLRLPQQPAYFYLMPNAESRQQGSIASHNDDDDDDDDDDGDGDGDDDDDNCVFVILIE